ncbi:MAG: sensor histidine kinase [Peptostreptococcaceae bacterium]|nr:sensor histidine kinase [Peptostreptococcaceae bacterium]
MSNMSYVVIAILIAFVLWQAYLRKKQNRELDAIVEMLRNIVEHNRAEKLFLFTDDKKIMDLLVQLNHLIEYNQEVFVEHRKMEASMKRMLSNISHDLKTPLTIILGYLETMSQDLQIDDETRMKMQKAHGQSIELLELINKFFDLAKLESNDKNIPLSFINVSEISRKNLLSLYDVINEKQMEVSIDIPEKDIFAIGNEEALGRILTNLMTNAIYHGGDGKIIGLHMEESDKKVYIHIWDKGRGIAAVHHEQVFERLFTLDDSRNKEYRGSGLGLTITKRLVEYLGGEIHLTSEPYKKTIFTVILKK